MRLIIAAALLAGFTGPALSLPARWQVDYCHKYADLAVAANKASISVGCNQKLKSLVSSDAWSNNWYGHIQWCLGLSNIAEAQQQDVIRRQDLASYCRGPFPF